MTLSTTQLQRLRPVLDAQSDERPDLQQLAAHNQVIGRETPLDSPLTEETTTPNLMGNTLNEALLAVLNKFTIDVTEKAREGAIDPVLVEMMKFVKWSIFFPVAVKTIQF